MKRRAAAPDRFALEDPSFDRQIQRALHLSLSPARRDPETSSSDKTPDDVFEPTAYFGVERNCVSGRYRVSIKKARGNPHILGCYASCTEAAAAYDEAALRIFSADKTETNFDKSTSQPLFNAPLPWKLQEDVWKPRPPSWYETLIADAIQEH